MATTPSGTWPISFPNECWQVVCNTQYEAGSFAKYNIRDLTKSGYSCGIAQGYFVVGY
ncbi:gp53-like domain-containing protein [Selenomonas montiformis]